MTDRVMIAGIGTTSLGKFLDRPGRSLSEEVARVALADAEIGAERVGRVFFANAELMNSPSGGLITMDHPIGPPGTAQLSELAQQLRGETGGYGRGGLHPRRLKVPGKGLSR
ncbi:hypothetical protein [Paenarthrobacter sp. YIM B13468]|uniref:hypothetical protein n=1 Tax=Paenarthrobacter sp. YIM B13468 TaxID=3366295 RepID=UPI00366F312F